MWRMIFLFLALSSLSIIVLAQDEPTTWPPNPDDIFSDQVTLTSVEDTSYVFSQVLTDDETKTMTIEQHGTIVRTVPYPPTLDSIRYAQLQSDGTFLIASDYDSETQLYHYVIYNSATGEISPAPTVCEGYLPNTSTPTEWVFVNHDSGKYLCNTTTDERYGPLPENIDWATDEFNVLAYATTSPDSNWVVLAAIRPETYTDSFEYYGFELATSNLNYLGKIYYDMFAVTYPSFGEWVSDSLGSIHDITGPESMSDGFYVFDVTQADSLELAAQGWVYDFYNDPPRYEYTLTDQFIQNKTGSVSREHTPAL